MRTAGVRLGGARSSGDLRFPCDSALGSRCGRPHQRAAALERLRASAAYAIARAPRSYRELLDPDALSGAAIGLVTNALGSDDDPESAPVNRVMAAAVEAIRGAGARVVEVTIPDLIEHIEATSQYVARTKHDINEFLSTRPELAGHTLQVLYETKHYHPELDLIDAVIAGPDEPEDDPDYFRRFAAREEFTRTVVNVMAANGLDTLVYPSVQVPSPSLEARRRWTTLTFPTNTLIASQTWMAAMTVPAGFTEQGLPVGLEFVAKPYDEPTVFRRARADVQQAGGGGGAGACLARRRARR
jgi:amidase